MSRKRKASNFPCDLSLTQAACTNAGYYMREFKYYVPGQRKPWRIRRVACVEHKGEVSFDPGRGEGTRGMG